MPKIAYIEKNFRDDKLELLGMINSIMNSYAEQGYDLSLRQLYYQLVSRDIIPNNQREYKNLGTLVNDGRMAGLLDWGQIVDRGRKLVEPPHWSDPADIIQAASNSFRIDKWETQPCHVMVAVEKQALEGVLEPVCKRLDVNFIANKGYSSQSTMWRIGEDLKKLRRFRRKRIVVLYLGDHDPSGLDMDRDVEERLSLFSGGPVEFQRLALLWEQIEELQPPENPAKLTDSRAKDYIAQHGYSSWELDAVEPKELDRMVTTTVESFLDLGKWAELVEEEARMRAEMRAFAENYVELAEYMDRQGMVESEEDDDE